MSFPIEKQSPTDLTPSTPTWSAVIVMSLCCAVLIASKFMPVSLLTPIAFDLKMTEGQVGQAIAISGIFAVMTSLIISKFTRKWDRRSVMLGLTLLMILSGVIITFAHNSILFILGRAILGIVIGGFWSMSTAIVMRLVRFNDVPKALGLLNGGNALATTIAAPLGSFLGSVMVGVVLSFVLFPLPSLPYSGKLKPCPPYLPSRSG